MSRQLPQSVRPYSLSDFEAMCSWYEKWGMGVPVPGMLPAIGFIAPGIAAGFLYRTDSSIAIVDSYIGNPDADKEARDQALDAITIELINKARDLGYAFIKCETKITSIEARALRLGFRALGSFACLVKEL